jgi:hypothetical protein
MSCWLLAAFFDAVVSRSELDFPLCHCYSSPLRNSQEMEKEGIIICLMTLLLLIILFLHRKRYVKSLEDLTYGSFMSKRNEQEEQEQ